MGDIKRQYRPNAADEAQQDKTQQRTLRDSWEVKQRGNDFDVVQPRSERAPREPSERSG
jgi:hypothetical protein